MRRARYFPGRPHVAGIGQYTAFSLIPEVAVRPGHGAEFRFALLGAIPQAEDDNGDQPASRQLAGLLQASALGHSIIHAWVLRCTVTNRKANHIKKTIPTKSRHTSIRAPNVYYILKPYAQISELRAKNYKVCGPSTALRWLKAVGLGAQKGALDAFQGI